MEEAPLIAEWDRLATSPNVVVVPFFISDGLHSYEDIPVLLGIATESPALQARAATQGRGARVGLRQQSLPPPRTHAYYASSIGTEAGFADVILDQVAAFDARHTA